MTQTAGKFRALVEEIEGTTALIRHGFSILATYSYAAWDAEPMFACFAGGAEKLLKLSIGLERRDRTGSWPSSAEMKGFGHNILTLNQHTLDLIEEKKPSSTAPGYIDQLQACVESDPIVQPLLETLSRYARMGRYYNLDHLADVAQLEPSPRELWEQLQQGIFTRQPELLRDLDTMHTRANGLIKESFAGWCELIARCWTTGMFGKSAKTWSGMVAASFRPPPSS